MLHKIFVNVQQTPLDKNACKGVLQYASTIRAKVQKPRLKLGRTRKNKKLYVLTEHLQGIF
jgi:hypothetical protein